MYIFAGGIFNSKISNDFHNSPVWSEVLNKLNPDVVVPTYNELSYGKELFTSLFNSLKKEPILTNNGEYTPNTKLNVNFVKHRIVEIKGRKILLLGVLCDLKIKGESSKYLQVTPIIEAVK